MVTIGDQGEGDVVVPAGQGRPLHPGGWPGVSGRTSPWIRASGEGEHQKPDLAVASIVASRGRAVEQPNGAGHARPVGAGRGDGHVMSDHALGEIVGQVGAGEIVGAPPQDVGEEPGEVVAAVLGGAGGGQVAVAVPAGLVLAP